MSESSEPTTVSSRLKLFWGISGVIFCLMVTIDVFFGKEMFEYSIQLSVNLQKLDLHSFAHFLSFILTPVIVSYPTFALFFQKDKKAALLHVFALCSLFFVGAAAKLIYQDGRPSFASTQLSQNTFYCERDYGKPSGHATLTSGVSVIILRDLTLYSKSTIVKSISFALAASCVALISVSRLFFGVHSINQVMLGVCLGIFVVLTVFVMRNLISDLYFGPILEKERLGRPKMSYHIILLLTFLLMTTTLSLLCLKCLSKEQTPDNANGVGESAFFNSIVNCSSVKGSHHTGFATKVTADGFSANLIVALLFGLALSPHPVQKIQVLNGDRSACKALLRFFIAIAFLSLVLLSKYPKVSDRTLYLAKKFLIPIFMGLLVGILLPALYSSLGLFNKEESSSIKTELTEPKLKLEMDIEN